MVPAAASGRVTAWGHALFHRAGHHQWPGPLDRQLDPTGLDISTTHTGPCRRVTQGRTTASSWRYLFIGLIFGLVNAFVKPIVSLLSLPITILTLGLFTVVINAAMLYLTSWLSSYTPVHFTIDSFFWTAVFAAIIISAVSLVASFLPALDR